eukprot:CAMPEP_0183732702 /NCGR_PEP_ID=MMETSP0737-20130205/39142_1 /TAXON_ID=385413 /ORGANISM="Thalassiosira miniscula, Strain CCMP1093" /LENGTH=65 /DNA_ID=CAMNT_0025965783 /DNA_START=79 /DNA_END=272 /DNA_ORIENTATION=-
MAASSVNITSRLSGDKFTSYMLLGSVKANKQAGRRRPNDDAVPLFVSAVGSNDRQTSPSTRDTDG